MNCPKILQANPQRIKRIILRRKRMDTKWKKGAKQWLNEQQHEQQIETIATTNMNPQPICTTNQNKLKP